MFSNLNEKNFLRRKEMKKNGNWTRGEGRMKRNLQTQIKFLYGLNAFSPFHNTFTLHDLGPGHPGTLEINRSADPPGNHVHHDGHLHYMEMTVHQLSYTEKSKTDNFPFKYCNKIKTFRNLILNNPTCNNIYVKHPNEK